MIVHVLKIAKEQVNINQIGETEYGIL